MFSKEKITVAYTVEKCEKCGMQKNENFLKVMFFLL